MDPVTTAIIAAVSCGAASGVNDAAKKAIGDSYEGIKAVIKRRFGSASDAADAMEKLEAKPDSQGRRETLAEELKSINAAADRELLSAAQSLLELIKSLPRGEQYVQVAHGIGIAQADHGSSASVKILGSRGGKDSV